jgi:hypothetical protein
MVEDQLKGFQLGNIFDQIQKQNLLKLSKEILNMTKFVQSFTLAHFEQQNDLKQKEHLVSFMVCLDFLIKGSISHWFININNSDNP